MRKVKRLTGQLDDWLRKNRLHPLKSVAVFMLITLAIHFCWRFWAYQLHYFPIREAMRSAGDFMAGVVFVQSAWFVEHVLNMKISTHSCTIQFAANNGTLTINSGCSGLKQFAQFALLMMLYPGPWKHKLWYIPVGIAIVHLTNLFRITGLSIVLVEWPWHWDFSHDYLFRPFFYVVIFLMWVIWEEKFRKK